MPLLYALPRFYCQYCHVEITVLPGKPDHGRHPLAQESGVSCEREGQEYIMEPQTVKATVATAEKNGGGK